MSEEGFMGNLYHIRNGKDNLKEMSFADQAKEVSNFLKHQCNSENLNFLIGSGASLPAVSLMSWTFDGIKQKEEIEPYLGKYKDSNDIENYLNWLNNAIAFYGEEYEEAYPYQLAFNTTKDELLKTIPRSYIGEMDASKGPVLDTLENYKDFYRNVFSQREFKNKTPLNVFTTNYDLFNEVAMENLGIHYSNGFKGSVNRVFDPYEYRLRLVDDENRYKEKWSTLRRYIKLHKIHGSVDWEYNDELNSIVQQKPDFKDNTENIMIYPTIHKHLESQQSPYSELIREFTTNLQKPNSTLIVIGYGFPDDHINQLISQSLNNEDFTLIVLGNVCEEKAKVFVEENDDRMNFHFIGGSFSAQNDGHHFANVIKYLGGEREDEEPE
ncbi:SIR2 family protein [Salibacterium aidingense]|uniref:SIR2 family protein n=1 Tax=Salibacterium aidingense TaxID=384933 RepID=UPI000413D1F8|nr:SIR2 family protein [Salibacterium aidingense]